MKSRFNTYDIVCMVTELQRLVGMRVNQVYDIDNKTYLIRLQRSEEKCVLLLESANRFHTTQFEWPKNVAPSGFTMKLRKHLKNKRLESMTQLGIDRVVDLQFGAGEAAYHVILELYDRGNIILTDYQWTILNVLRPHVEGDKIRFAVKEKYPLDRAKTNTGPPTADELQQIISKSKTGDNLKKILNPNLEYGPAIIDHVLSENGLAGNMKLSNDPNKGFNIERDLEKLVTALKQAEQLLESARSQTSKGFIIQKKEARPHLDGEEAFLLANVEFHPMLFNQHLNQPYVEYDTFDRAVDEFFSALEGQKIDLKTVQVEREAMKKLQNVRKDHEKRMGELEVTQLRDKRAAELIARNEPLVEQARMAVQAALANQMSWEDINELVKTAQNNQDPIASCIKELKLKTNHITLLLSDPYHESDDDHEENDDDHNVTDDSKLEPMMVDIDLSLTAFANARRYYDQKRNAAKKQQKTVESVDKALKSAERKTKMTLKEANAISNISKARRTYWFEKFFWFISSDNYLVIGGRDHQQNDLVVKRYMRPCDLYVHADVAGASSLVIKNPRGGEPPPRTISEAGHAAVAYSIAWEAKVMTSAWWVRANQVSKSAPTGEYLAPGSFMIRGKKNYILPHVLQLGFTFMFRLEDSCIERHRGDRRPLVIDSAASENTSAIDQEEDQEIAVSDDDDLSDKEDKVANTHLESIKEEVSLVHTEDEQDSIQTKEHKTEITKNDNCDADDSSDDGFPDTHIKVNHDTGKVVMESKMNSQTDVSTGANEKLLSFPSLPKKGGNKKQPQHKAENQTKKEEKPKEGLKRGQKAKLKKIKEKYKDQDEEDRAMMMEYLQGKKDSGKETKKAQKGTAKVGKSKAIQRAAKIPQPAPLILEADSDEEDIEPEVDNQTGDADTEILWQLTGCPLPEDELLFAVPVVAPYSTLHNYKYKVKLTPGTSKRGKAAKTAVQVFLKDRACTARERDLLKAVKDEDVARNFPGKVKLSAPQLHKHKK